MEDRRKADLPVFEETMKQFQNLSFLRDTKGRWVEGLPVTGWYQDSEGSLYHYDGVIWDKIPEERTEKLEYLG